jgi:NAD(P)-dependent dehydrogenase (short-subunit alcohol dehydrogenase family)
MTIRLAGITALVTGANRGIGRALVEALAARGATRVYAAARQPASLVALDHPRVVPIQLDVTKPDQIEAAARTAGDVALLINNAGVVAQVGPEFLDATWLDAGRLEYEVNVLGALAVAQAFAPALARNGGGAVVNLSSVAALAAFPLLPSYSASKAAVHSLTQATRVALKAQGTFVAGVYPGPIDTDMSRPFNMPKTPPRVAAEAILDGIEAAREEIFPDPLGELFGGLFLRSPKALERQFTQGETRSEDEGAVVSTAASSR